MWRLLLPIGRRISIETLEGQVLAIDASIWLTQFLTVAARQREQDLLGDDSYGNSSNRSSKAYSYDYLVGFLRRLCKLRYQGVRPVLVFDGETPEIKKREIRERNKRRKRKLGETFYLGDNNNRNGDVPTQEEEEMLEATRRMAKRILAKQLKSGRLVTTKSKQDSNKKLKTIKHQSGTLHKSTSAKSKEARASYAPGFYDPDAPRAGTSEQQAEQQVSSTKKLDPKHIEDDHLLRDDYNTSSLKEEINDWDKPIVVDSDDESRSTYNNNNSNDHSATNRPHNRKQTTHFFGSTSRFHAGDGTKFKVESVADLPESARKDVIEDARKQRRLASRREFMGVASDPDGLSSCQLRNFLKSTKLNRDIATMAQQAKQKAEEEAKMTLGNGILFEKDDDAGFQRSGSNKKIRGVAATRRQHYRSDAYNTIGLKGRKKSNSGMMRMFHHKDQRHKDTTNDEDDAHDFRKARNNHYLSGGIRFVNSDKDKEEIDYLENHLNEEKDVDRSYYNMKTTDDDGGFAVAIMDGSSKARTKITDNALTSNDGDNIIEIDSSSESEFDDSRSKDDRKPTAAKRKRKSTKESQELQDEALARALQNIEEEERVAQEDAEECIESDDSDGNDSNDDGGFFRNALPSPSNEQIDPKLQQKRDDARLARALQENEYGNEEDSDGGGGFLLETKEDNANMDENIHTTSNGGFLVAAKEDKLNTEENIEIGRGFLVSTNKDRNANDDDSRDKKGFFAPTEKDRVSIINSKSLQLPSHRVDRTKDNAKMTRKEASLFLKADWNLFESNHSENNVSNGIFATSKHKGTQNAKSDLLVCPESSEEEEDHDIEWEEGNDTNDIAIQQNEDSNAEKIAIECSVSNNPTHNAQKKKDTSAIDTKITDGNSSNEVGGDEEVDWEDGSEEINGSISAVIDTYVGKNGTRPTHSNKSTGIEETIDNDDNSVDWEEGDNEKHFPTKIVCDASSENTATKQLAETSLNPTDIDKHKSNVENEEEENEVDWEDGDEEINQNKPADIDLCEGKKSDHSYQKTVPKESDDEDNVHDEEDENEVALEDGDGDEIIDLFEEREISKPSIKPAFVPVERNEKSSGESNVPTKNMKGEDGKLSKVHHYSSNQEVEEVIDNKNNSEATSRYFDKSKKLLSESKAMVLEYDSDENTGIEWEAGEGENPTMVKLDDWGATGTHASDEVAVALEHAQGTAANLTNWAGRAFRRAIAQHAIENGMEVPESAKPTMLKTARNETDRDEPGYDEAKTTTHYPQRASKVNIKSRNQERRTEGDQNDNSGWLETVGTDNTYTEDYTVAPQEANPSDRLLDAATGGITEEMRTEVMQLLRLFGIPYVVAPAEAEAQCVELERLGLVDGIVTEDSDTFVFGGQVVYKNIFHDKKYVEVYHAKDASEEMNLTQDSMIALAMLLGGDYTDGVKGVGIVNGMEVLQAFDVAQDCQAGLKRFRKWLDGFDPNDLTKKSNLEDTAEVRSKKEQVFHRKHHTARTRWIAPKHFPDAKVLNAYLNPVVDTSTERFSWGVPDLDGLIAFCHGHMGWVAEETEKLLVPIIQQMEGGSMRQTRIDSFMRYEDGITFAKVQSKRLRQVLGLSSKDMEQPQRKRIQQKAPSSSLNEDEEKGNNEFSEEEEDSFCEPDKEIFTAMDVSSMAMYSESHSSKAHANSPKQKKYNGKRTRSLALLSSASASTIAIASSSKSDGIISASADGASVSVARQSRNLPKKGPPSYQKQSSTILEEEKDSASTEETKSRNVTYEVINPSMI